MTPEITALVAGIRGTIDVVRGLKSSYDAHAISKAQSEILDRLLAVQGDALTLQEKHFSLIQENETLSRKLQDADEWKRVKESLVLKEVSARVYVYISKSPETTVTNPPYYCANCYGLGQLSILQYSGNGDDYHQYDCQRCGKHFKYNTGSPDAHIEPLDSSDLNF
jgi:hypothetical protein